MRLGEAINLIQNEKAKYDECSWVVPESLSEESGYQPQLDDSVGEQIERGKILGTNRKMLRGAPQVICQKVTRIFCEFSLRNGVSYAHEKRLSYKKRCNTTDNFDRRKQSFHPEAYMEGEPDVFFVKCPHGETHPYPGS